MRLCTRGRPKARPGRSAVFSARSAITRSATMRSQSICAGPACPTAQSSPICARGSAFAKAGIHSSRCSGSTATSSTATLRSISKTNSASATYASAGSNFLPSSRLPTSPTAICSMGTSSSTTAPCFWWITTVCGCRPCGGAKRPKPDIAPISTPNARRRISARRSIVFLRF